MITLAILMFCWLQDGNLQPVGETIDAEMEQDDNQVVVYYLNRRMMLLQPTIRKLLPTSSDCNRVKQVIEWLSIHPEEDGLISIWPDAVFLRDVFIVDDEIVVVDIYSTALGEFNAGVVTEGLLIHSLVNSILQSFPWQKEVWILVDGGVQDTFLGHIDIEKPLKFNQSTVLKEESEGQQSEEQP
ncbi:MAG: hypothetical protein CSA81_01020 [Acidobacteria bacterium]|nr:MAG: hypothetical protein CSA81_01020 [Acidobacteriota bacterium]